MPTASPASPARASRAKRTPKRRKPRSDRAVKTAEVDQALGRGDAKCGAAGRKGRPCRKPAGWGTEHQGLGRCKLHGGNTPAQVRRVEVVRAAAAVELYGLPRELDPHDALLEELARTAGHVDWLRLKVGELGDHELVGPVGTEGMTEEGLEHHPKAEPSIWIRLYAEERQRLVSVAATCIKAGIEERRVRIAERDGQLLAQVIQGILGDLKVPAEKARPIVRKHLLAIETTATEVAA